MNGPPEPAKQPEADPLVGTTVGGRFHIERRIAAGGMGVVYQALQQPLGRPVAVKILRAPQDPRLDESHSQRFLREAAVVANLNHPNTVVVHDYGHDGPLLYFAMEYLEGETLSGRLRRTQAPLTPEAAIHVADQIASSLVDAHAAGLIHRDLKPGNVMLLNRSGDPDFVKVLDFGLVKLVQSEAAPEGKDLRLTQSGILMGSPRYMSPEQVRGKEVDHRADIYSFGALLCFVLTGHPPFPAGSQFEAMRAHVYNEPPTLRSLDPTCFASERIETLIHQCLAKDPADRPQSMSEVRAALAACRLAPRADDVDDARRTVARDLQVPEGTSSVLSMALVNPGRSVSAWALRIGLVAAFLIAGAAIALLLPRPEDGQAVAIVDPPPPSPTPGPTASPPEVLPNTVEQDPTPTPTPAIPEEMVVEVRSDPPGARVRTNDGRDLGRTPVSVTLDPSEPMTVQLSAAGHVTTDVLLTGEQSTFDVQLRRRAGGGRPSMVDNTTTTPDTPQSESMTTRPPDGPIRDPWM